MARWDFSWQYVVSGFSRTVVFLASPCASVLREDEISHEHLCAETHRDRSDAKPTRGSALVRLLAIGQIAIHGMCCRADIVAT